MSLAGLTLLTVAAMVIAGWVMNTPGWVRPTDGAAMVLNTALCFGLVAFALLSEFLPGAPRRWIQSCLGLAVTALAGLVLGEHLLGRDLGIDWSALHSWHQDDNPHPGRMSPLTSVAFVVCGTVFVLMHRVRRLWQGLLVQALTMTVAAIGVIGIAGHMLRLTLIYDNYPFGQMAPVTAAGFVLIGVALWFHWAQSDWYRSRALVVHKARHISLNSAVVLAGIVCISILAGLVLAQRQIEILAADSLLWPLKGRVDLFRINIDLRSNRVVAVATRPEFTQMLVALNNRPSDQQAINRLHETAESFLTFGFAGIAFQDADGKEWARVGRFSDQPALKVELKTPSYTSFLMWSGEHFVLQTRMPLLHDNVVVGVMAAEQRLTALTSALEYAGDFATTGEISVCARQKERISCFPQRYNPKVFDVPYSSTSPMARALAEESGVTVTRDTRSRRVMAAYGPIGTLGLGMVVKVDTAELYAPLRQQLYLLLVLALTMVAGGTLLLYWQVTPLARNLYVEEQRLKLALESSRTAWWDWEIRTGKIQLSEHWQSLLGNPAQMTTTTLDELEKLAHPDDLPHLRRKLAAAIRSSVIQYDAEHRVQRSDGSWMWVHSTGRVVARDSENRALRMIGINSDISQRKEAALKLELQTQHDALTGLFNRRVFDDRLKQALTRAHHKGDELIAVIYLDIDMFKQINDSFGQPAGDSLLKEFAQRLTTCVRAMDTVARLIGDKYAIVLENLESRDEGSQIVEKILESVRPAFAIQHRTIEITASAGIVYYYGEDEEPNPEMLVQTAELAHYEAKNVGRDTYIPAN